MAKASGWNFNYVSFHYYPRVHDGGFWMDKYLGQARAASKKFGVPIFFNEINCGEIYDGKTDGSGQLQHVAEAGAQRGRRPSTATSLQEVTVYEMLDQPDMAGVERFFGVCYVLNNCKPTAATVAQFGAMSGGGTTPPVTPPVEPPVTPPGTLPPGSYTINGPVTLTPVK